MDQQQNIMGNAGYIPINRKFFDNWLWKMDREYSYAEAWLYLIKEARYSDGEITRLIDNKLITWSRGQLVGSLRNLEKAWKWKSTTRVRTFLCLLEKDGMITTDSTQGVNIITLCKYEDFNVLTTVEQDTPNTPITQPKHHDSAGLTHCEHKTEIKDNKEIINNISPELFPASETIVQNPKVNNDQEFLAAFDEARKIYPGTKNGNKVEFENFTKKHKNWKEILPLLKQSIEKQIAFKKSKAASNQFVAEWKHFSTWINKSCWEEETGSYEDMQKKDPNLLPSLTQEEVDDLWGRRRQA